MIDNFKKEDIRIKKTYIALINSMLTILNRKNWQKITVHDLCEKALVSRATFYIHFNHKYELLKYWLLEISEDIIKDVYEYDKLEKTINQFVFKNKKVIKNILKDADNETIEIIKDIISSIIDDIIKRNSKDTVDLNYIILSNFCKGGIVELLLLQVKNNFPSNANMMSSYLYQMIKTIIQWDRKQS